MLDLFLLDGVVDVSFIQFIVISLGLIAYLWWFWGGGAVWKSRLLE
jgi:hypothetical protein